jgi:hypothetical protein
MEASVLRFDVASDSWSERRPMPGPRGIGQAVAVGDLIYLLGGCRDFGAGLASVDVYSPERDSWWAVSAMQTGNHDFGAGVWRDRFIYVVGGGNWRAEPTNSVLVFDTRSQSWQTATPLPEPLGACAAGVIGDEIVVSTGYHGAATNVTYVGAIDPAEPTRIRWRRGPALPGELRCRAAAGVWAEELFVIGGTLNDGRVLREVWSFRPSTGSWARWADKPTGIANVFGVSAGTDAILWLPGGFAWTSPYARATEGLDLRPFEHDLRVVRLVPNGRVRPDFPIAVEIALRNCGRSSEELTLDVAVRSESDGRVLIEEHRTMQLAAGAERVEAIGLPGIPERTCVQLQASARCPVDENPDNNALTSRLEAGIGSQPDGFGYRYFSTQEPDTVAFDWVSAGPGRLLSGWLPDPDDGYVRCRLPFGFPYYGQELNEFYVLVNGCLATDSARFHFNESLPSRGQNRIAVWWDDLDLSAGGEVRQYDDPSGEFSAITWLSVPIYRTLDNQTFQAVLYRDGRVRFNYLEMHGTGASSTVGIQGRAGADGWHQQYVFNGAPARHLVADSTSLLFEPAALRGREQQPQLRDRWQVPVLFRSASLHLPAWLPSGRLRIVTETGRIAREIMVPEDGAGRAVSLLGLHGGVYFARFEGAGVSTGTRIVLLH